MFSIGLSVSDNNQIPTLTKTEKRLGLCKELVFPRQEETAGQHEGRLGALLRVACCSPGPESESMRTFSVALVGGALVLR